MQRRNRGPLSREPVMPRLLARSQIGISASVWWAATFCAIRVELIAAVAGMAVAREPS
jgi:hypothetical protein